MFSVVINPKEVTVYPDDIDKPPVGEGLNKHAQIRLDGYWPICKTTRQPIHDPERLAQMNYVGKLKKSTSKIGAVFVDYLPDTGTCIFRVSYSWLMLYCGVGGTVWSHDLHLIIHAVFLACSHLCASTLHHSLLSTDCLQISCSTLTFAMFCLS